ncbi:MAG: hypothetical protein ACOC4M_18075 [Promethearchaeia archaeon]
MTYMLPFLSSPTASIGPLLVGTSLAAMMKGVSSSMSSLTLRTALAHEVFDRVKS